MSFSVQRSALVNYSAQQMFDLVNDIEAYPQYMEGCISAQILQRQADFIQAKLELGKGGITQSFITNNQLQPPTKMTMTLEDGPFSHLHGCWEFVPLNETSCKVNFELQFRFKNPLLGMAMGKVFENVASKQVDSLCARAGQIYG